MNDQTPIELWEWTEFYCPWSYVAAVRLHKVAPEYEGRVRLRIRAFPLEVYGGGPPDRKELELEMWLAALQEPEAEFAPFKEEWPATTLPAFEVAWCAFQQDEKIGREFDLKVRRAFFAEGRDIGRWDVVNEIAEQAGLDMDRLAKCLQNGEAHRAILEEGRLGKETFQVRETPTVMLPDGSLLHHALSTPKTKDHKILSVEPLPCCGEGCYEATRQLFEEALKIRSAEYR